MICEHQLTRAKFVLCVSQLAHAKHVTCLRQLAHAQIWMLSHVICLYSRASHFGLAERDFTNKAACRTLGEQQDRRLHF